MCERYQEGTVAADACAGTGGDGGVCVYLEKKGHALCKSQSHDSQKQSNISDMEEEMHVN